MKSVNCLVKCKCGCGELFMVNDSRGRKRKFIQGHNAKLNPPMKGRTHTKKAKEKLSKLNTGKKLSIKTRKKMSDQMSGEKHYFYGKKHSYETKKKIGEASKGRVGYWLNKKRNITPEWREKMRVGLKLTCRKIEYRIKKRNDQLGSKGSNWKGGITSKNSKIRHSLHTKLWREAVFERDNWTCQKCFNRGGKLRAHHIKNFSEWSELRFSIDNGITFCQHCHVRFHKIYGLVRNNEKQIKEYL